MLLYIIAVSQLASFVLILDLYNNRLLIYSAMAEYIKFNSALKIIFHDS